MLKKFVLLTLLICSVIEFKVYGDTNFGSNNMLSTLNNSDYFPNINGENDNVNWATMKSLIGSSSPGGWTSDSSTKTTTTYNVGIGTTTPSQKLDVSGVINSSAGYATGTSIAGIWKRNGTVLTSSITADSNNVYEPTLIPPEGSCLVLTALSSCFKMYFTSGWVTPQINYAESADGLNWSRYSSAIVAAHARSFVIKNAGTYYMYASNTAGTSLDEYTSSNGRDFSLANTGVLTSAGLGGVVENSGGTIVAGVLYLFVEYKVGAVFKIGLFTSSNFSTFVANSGNPLFTGTGSFGGPSVPYLIGSNWYMFVHNSPTGTLPTDLYMYTATALTGPWTNTLSGIAFPRSSTDEGISSTVGQVADPFLIEINSKTYLYYSASTDGSLSTAGQHIKLALADMTMASLIGTSQGIDQGITDIHLWTKDITGNGISYTGGIQTPTLTGDSIASGTLTLNTTSNATKGKILIGSVGAFDENNVRFGIGTTSPTGDLHVENLGTTGPRIIINHVINKSGLFAFKTSAVDKWAFGHETDSSLMYYDQVAQAYALRLYQGASVGNPGAVTLQEAGGKVGIGTTAPDKSLEINLGTANAFRLSYNDSNGSAANYTDMTVDSGGDLTIAPSGADTNITGNQSTTGTIKSTRTTDIGWSIVAGANTACNTTCTNACVMGFDAGTVGVLNSSIVACTDATADSCLCAGAS